MSITAMAAPTVKVDDGFYEEAKVKGVCASKLLGRMDPSPPEHIEFIMNEKRAEWGLDDIKGGIAPGRLAALREWAIGAAAIERQVAADENFVGAGGIKYATVKDWFAATGSVAVFPAWIDSQIQAGLIKVGYAPEMVFATEDVDSPQVITPTLSDNDWQRSLDITAPGADLREVNIALSSGTISLSKFGRAVKAPYEIVGARRVDVIGTILQRIGQQIAVDETDRACHVTIAGDGTTLGAAESNSTDIDADTAGTVTYAELIETMLSPDDPYMPNYFFTDSAGMKLVANLPEFKDPDVRAAAATVDFPTPLQCRWRRITAATRSSYVTGLIVGLDTRVALKKLMWGPMLEETDKDILKQKNLWTFSFWSGFQKWDVNGVVPYDWNAAL